MKKFEPDFSDITGGKSKPAVAKKKVPKQEQEQLKRLAKEKEKTQLSGIIVSVPVEGKPGHWIIKDLVECNGAEFSLWARTIWPCFELPEENCNFPQYRYEKFKQIISFNRVLKLHDKPKTFPQC